MLKSFQLSINHQFILPQQHIDFGQWHHDVCILADMISQYSEQNWLLFDDDFYRFSVYFFALIKAKKHLVLPQNNQPDFIESISATFERQCGTDDHHLFDQVSATKNDELKIAAQSAARKSEPTIDFSFDTDVTVDFYTSGSSSAPQRITKKLSQLTNEVETLTNQWPNHSSTLTHLALISHQHIYGLLFKFLWPLLAGRDIYCESQKYPEQLRSVMTNDTQYVIVASPAFLSRLCDDNLLVDCCQNIEQIFSSGGPLSSSTSETLKQQLNVETTEVFGSTETGGIAYKQTSDNQYWRVFNKIEIKAEGAAQLLQVKSSHLSDDNWYLTSDKIELINKRQFCLLGRSDQVVKIEEKRVSLTSMKQRIVDTQWINECHTLVLPGKRTQIAVVAVLSDYGHSYLENFGKAALVKQIKQQLMNYFELVLIPRKWRFVQEMPYNSQSKLIQSEIVSLFK